MTDLAILKQRNQARWAMMVINGEPRNLVQAVAARLMTSYAMGRYASVEAKTGVPRCVIAVIHEREASQDWNANIAQGDPWNRVSFHTPKGRGPFTSWEEAAIDALTNCPPYAAKWKDWSAGGALTLLEQYNGLGYANKGVPSPYIWASTNQYVSGKYVADGVYDPTEVDKQIGCAALLKQMGAFVSQPSIPTPAPSPQPPASPQQKPQSPSNFVQIVLEFILNLFRRK